MTAPTLAPNPHLATVQSAMTAISQALDDAERQTAERTLLTAGVALQEQCWKKHQWLVRNWDILDQKKLTLSTEEYAAKETIYLQKIAEYQEMVNVLAEALVIINMPDPTKEAMAQGALL